MTQAPMAETHLEQESSEIDELLARIEATFGLIPVPSKDEIVYDNSGRHLECEAIRDLFGGRHWRSVDPDELHGLADSLFFFTPKGFRFYLPAFLRACLVDPEGADLIPEVILSSLVNLEPRAPGEGKDVESVGKGESMGIPSALVRELRKPSSGGADEARRKRRRELRPAETAVLREFTAFLRRHREEEFATEELDIAEDTFRGPTD